MNATFVTLLILAISVFLIWACKTKKFDNLFSVIDQSFPTTVNTPITTLPAPAPVLVYPQYYDSLYNRYPFNVPWRSS